MGPGGISLTKILIPIMVIFDIKSKVNAQAKKASASVNHPLTLSDTDIMHRNQLALTVSQKSAIKSAIRIPLGSALAVGMVATSSGLLLVSQPTVAPQQLSCEDFRHRVYHSIELYSLIPGLQAEYGWKLDKARLHIDQYRETLCVLNQNPDQMLILKSDIDAVLHEHVLRTDKFREDSMLLFGQSLDHIPLDRLETRWGYTPEEVNAFYDRTQEQFAVSCPTPINTEGNAACGLCFSSYLYNQVATQEKDWIFVGVVDGFESYKPLYSVANLAQAYQGLTT
jgi:hypothetical protein